VPASIPDLESFTGKGDRRGARASRRVGVPIVLAVVLFLALSGRAEAMLYWANGNGIERMDLDGSFRSDVPDFSRAFPGGFIRSTGDVCGLAVDATHIFWANRSSNSIGRANLDGSDPNYALITGADEPCGIAIDSSHVFWANLGGTTIGRANLDGTDVDQDFIEAGDRPCGVAVNGSNVFWGSGSGNFSLGRADLDGENPVQDFLPTAGAACGVAVDASHIFWSDFLGTIGRADVGGTNAEPELITGLDRPCAVAVDPAHVYWTEESVERGNIGQANLDGANVNRSFLPGQGSMCSVAVDSLHYVPPPASSIRLGKLRRNERKGVAYIAVDVPDSGQFTVEVTNGLSWRFVGEGVGPALSGGGRKWLRIWPSPKGWDGPNLRRQLRNKGRARVRVSVKYGEIYKAPTTRTRSLVLIQERAQRR